MQYLIYCRLHCVNVLCTRANQAYKAWSSAGRTKCTNFLEAHWASPTHLADCIATRKSFHIPLLNCKKCYCMEQRSKGGCADPPGPDKQAPCTDKCTLGRWLAAPFVPRSSIVLWLEGHRASLHGHRNWPWLFFAFNNFIIELLGPIREGGKSSAAQKAQVFPLE